jgi:hypothetical protein
MASGVLRAGVKHYMCGRGVHSDSATSSAGQVPRAHPVPRVRPVRPVPRVRRVHLPPEARTRIDSSRGSKPIPGHNHHQRDWSPVPQFRSPAIPLAQEQSPPLRNGVKNWLIATSLCCRPAFVGADYRRGDLGHVDCPPDATSWRAFDGEGQLSEPARLRAESGQGCAKRLKCARPQDI